jgi:hypothetical protein
MLNLTVVSSPLLLDRVGRKGTALHGRTSALTRGSSTRIVAATAASPSRLPPLGRRPKDVLSPDARRWGAALGTARREPGSEPAAAAAAEKPLADALTGWWARPPLPPPKPVHDPAERCTPPPLPPPKLPPQLPPVNDAAERRVLPPPPAASTSANRTPWRWVAPYVALRSRLPRLGEWLCSDGSDPTCRWPLPLLRSHSRVPSDRPPWRSAGACRSRRSAPAGVA